MNNKMGLVSGIGLGLGVMYYLDPDRGKRRRLGVRDQMTHQASQFRHGINLATHDLGNRVRGLAARSRHRLLPAQIPHVDEGILIARVRSKLGRHVSHPHAIEVSARDGHITLKGPILSDELKTTLAAVASVPGVRQLSHLLEPHGRDEVVPSLQGGRNARGERFELLQTHWSPAARLIVGVVSAGALAFGIRSRKIPGLLLSGASLGFLARALTNTEATRLYGLTGPRAISVHKTIHIKAPIKRVFDFWSDFRNFAQFLPDVLEVRPMGDNRFHWRIHGPAGIPVTWNAATTLSVANDTIAWKSEPNSLVRNEGRIRFIRGTGDSTTVEIHLAYSPPAGSLGHAIARLLGADPKHKLDDDLMRVKTLLEKGPSERQLKHALQR